MRTALVGVTKPGAGRDDDQAGDGARAEAEHRRLAARHPLERRPDAAATAVARVVAVNAFAAMPSAATALPALKPYQPTHSMPVPTMVRTRLCGMKARLPKPVRLPRMRQSTSADQPDDMWTTVPPAKSIALMRGLGVPHAVHEAVDAPHHVGEREVDDEHPEHDERHDRRVLHALGDRADDERRA